MSNTENTSVESNDDDLDLFAAELFGQSKAAPEEATSEETDLEDNDRDANEQSDEVTDDEVDTLDENEDSDDEDDSDDNDDSDDDVDDEPKPKQKKDRAQKRIKELNSKYREEERQRLALEARLAELEAKLNNPEPKNEKTDPQAKATDGPSPDEKNEDGSEKYPLGEYDPQYIRDLARHTIQKETEAAKLKEAEEAREREIEAAREELSTHWQDKVSVAEKKYPDFREVGEPFIDSFRELEQGYAEYLAGTLMEMDYGPDVLYYLANHPDEAQAIVNSGAKRATIALGRLEAKFADAEAEKKTRRPKVSNAPTPPDTRLKGTSAALPDVPDDTDDLEAFERKLFKKR